MKSELHIQNRISPLLRMRNLCFIIYFALLLCERLAGGILGIFLGGSESMLGADTLIPKLVHPITLAALLIGIIVMRRQWIPLLRTVGGNDVPLNTYSLSAGIGFFLLSGMMHTGFLLLSVQFTAYGFLIIGLILHEIGLSAGTETKERILATTYLLCFSMTVPVVYDTAISGVHGGLFVAVELITTFYLIFAFASMTEVFLRTGRCGANPTVLVLMLLLVGAVFFLRLPESANLLIAIFAVLTLFTWIFILILRRRSIRVSLNPLDFTLPEGS